MTEIQKRQLARLAQSLIEKIEIAEENGLTEETAPYLCDDDTRTIPIHIAWAFKAVGDAAAFNFWMKVYADSGAAGRKNCGWNVLRSAVPMARKLLPSVPVARQRTKSPNREQQKALLTENERWIFDELGTAPLMAKEIITRISRKGGPSSIERGQVSKICKKLRKLGVRNRAGVGYYIVAT